jgi:hypothetical protein
MARSYILEAMLTKIVIFWAPMDLLALVLDHSPWLRATVGRLAARWEERRDLQPEVLRRVLDPTLRRATLILGPRQVGKSVILWQIAEDLLKAEWPPEKLLYFDFSDERIVEPISARDVLDAVRRFSEMSSRRGNPDVPQVLLLDEISNVPNWDRWLKQAVDRSGDRIVVTDSAASLLREGARESGQGRWDERILEGLTFAEFARLSAAMPNPLSRYLEFGGFPEFVAEESRSHVRRALREDVANKALERDLLRHVDDIEAARRLFVYLVQDSGSSFNASKRADDLDRDRKEMRKHVTDWTQMFLDSALLVSLPGRPLDRKGRKGKATERLGAHPRIYAGDHGLIHAFSPLPDPFFDPAVRGQVFESTVFRHLRSLPDAAERVFFYRERDKHELDFVLDLDGGPVALEVTSAGRVTDKVGKVAAAAERIGAERAILIYGGSERKNVHGVDLLPLPAFLSNPADSVLGNSK